MTKAVQKKQRTEVSNYNQDDMAAWGGNAFTQSDIIIPKLVLMQASSTLVADNDNLKAGDYIHSVTKEVVGNAKKPIKIIPFYMKKFYRVTVAEGRDFVFDHMEAWDHRNDGAPNEFMHNGKAAQRQKVYQFYALLNDEPLPFIVTMKGLSFRTGKQLANEMYLVNQMKQLPPPGRTFELGVEDTEFEGKKYKAFTVKDAGETPREIVTGTALQWLKTISAGDVVEHSDESVEAEKQTQSHATHEVREANGQFEVREVNGQF
jgi:hypothetical protein